MTRERVYELNYEHIERYLYKYLLSEQATGPYGGLGKKLK